MQHPTRDLVTDWRKEDAEKLATLEMEADAAWPGGGGWQTTPEETERHFRQSDLLGAFVTEDGERMVSICTLNAKPGQKEHAFVPHLNCHPKYHGKKYGKAVLRAAVERAYERGYRKVNLYTWPGNMRAVPLYKKTGFMWEPDTSVHMENFTPAARRHPLGRAFFARHDWYDTQVRELNLEEDRVERGKVKVYEYLWKAEDGEFLRMVFDRQSWGLIEIENGDLLLSCSLTDEKLVAGMPHPVRWRIVNKRSDPVQVFLTASGDPGVEVEKREVLEVKDCAEVEGMFTVDPNIKEKTQDPRAAILRTDMVIDGVGIELAAGIDVQQAVSVSLDLPRAILRPGAACEARLSLRSNLDKPCTARVSVAPAGGVSVGKRDHRVTLAAWGGAELPVSVTATDAGAAALDVVVDVTAGRQKVSTKAQRVDMLAAAPGDVAGSVGERRAYLCGGGLAVDVGLRNGDASVYHTLRGGRSRRMEIRRPQLGPPFSGQDLFDEKAEAWIEREAFGVVLGLRTGSVLRPGVALERRISVGRGPIVRVVDTVINGSARVYDLSSRQGWSMQMGDRSELVVPRKDGVYRNTGGAGGRHLDQLKLPEAEQAWPEQWVCMQRDDGCAAGILWHGAERAEARRWGEMQRRVGRVAPGQTARLAPIYAFVGDGNWQTVRGWWQMLVGDGPPEVEAVRPTTHRPIALGLAPSPVLVKDGAGEAVVFLHSPGEHKLDGTLALDVPSGVRSDLRSVKVAGLCAAGPVARKMQLRAGKRTVTGALDIGVRFETEEAIYRDTGRALVLPTSAPEVRIAKEDGGKAIAIDNGILTARVAPGFCGAVISLKMGGKEYLSSAYPEARIRGWENPWHGGIRPHCGRMWGILHKEVFRYRVIRRKGRQGLVWRGVRVHCTMQHERGRGQSIALDYLLAPGADVLAILPRCRDEAGLGSNGHAAFLVYPAFAESSEGIRFYNQTEPSITPLGAPHWSGAGDWHWGGIVGADGRALFVSAQGEDAQAEGESMGKDGCILYGGVGRWMPAGGQIEGLFFVAPGMGEAVAETHAVWSEFEELP